MYRPGTESHYRPRTVPPPPPQGMMNYIPQRPLPPPIHGRPYTASQFSYASGPPPPPMVLQVPSFSSTGLAVHPPPPGPHAPPFVPPLPADLPPPPPASPPPSPPPLPSEASIHSDSLPTQSLQDLKPRSSSSDSLSESKGFSDTKCCPGFYDGSQQKILFQHVSSEAGSVAIRRVGLESKILQPQQHSDWNSTYQDTLDDEAGSPATSDMDMDMEDAGQLDAGNTKASMDEEVNSLPKTYARLPEGKTGNVLTQISETRKEMTFQGTGISDWNLRKQTQGILDSDFVRTKHASDGEDHTKMVSRSNIVLAKDIEKSESIHEGHGRSSASAMPRTVDEISSCSGIEQTFIESEDHQRERSGRWESPPSLQHMQVVNESPKNDHFSLLTSGRENLADLGKSRNRADTFMDSQGSNVAAGIGGGISLKLEEQSNVGIGGDAPSGSLKPVKAHPTSQQQEQKKGPTMDEFGRLAQEAESDSESDGNKHSLPIDEFGRVVQKRASGSDSEGGRRPSKRKRSYSRSRSNSRSRSRSRGRGRGRGRSKSRSQSSRSSSSRSRSRSSSSRSPARSSGWRRRSYSRSPRRKMRWSRSRSRSPEWRRSYSRTPPRDMRWGGMGRGDRDWRSDREYFGRGRRGGRSGGPNPCYHYARGRCFRGSSCRYLHVSREVVPQERGAWRRDPQLERPNPDAAREDFSGDQHNRGPWRRDLRLDRPDDLGGAHQDYMGERQKKEFVSNSNIPQEDFGREPSFNRPIVPFPQGELWTPRSADEAKDRQVMAYNKALELVGIQNVPSEKATTEEVGIHDVAQVDEKFDYRTGLREGTMRDVSFTTTDTSRELTLVNSADAGKEIPIFGGTTSIGLVHSPDKEPPTVTNNRAREVEVNDRRKESETVQHLDVMGQDASRDSGNIRIMKEETDGKANGRELLERHHSGEVLLSNKEDMGNILNGLEEYDNCRDTEVCKVAFMNSDMDAVNSPSRALVEIPADKGQELCEPDKEELTSNIDPGNKNLGDLNSTTELELVPDLDALEKDTITLGDASEQLRTEVLEKPKATVDSDAVANSKEGLKPVLEAEVIGKLDGQSVDKLEQTGGLKISDSGDAENVCMPVAGELHATAAKAADTEVHISQVNSASLLAHTSQGQQHTLIGLPGSGHGILPSPSDVQQHIGASQPISAPGVVPLIPPQGQFQAPTQQPFAQSYPLSTMDMPRGAQYSSYRLPVTTPQTFDQAARPMARFNSGNAGYPTAGGWRQTSFQPRAPTQEALPLNQVHGISSYGTASRPSPGSSTTGAPFYGTPNQGDKFPHLHGAPYPADQFSQHLRASNPGDQFCQLQRPPNTGAFGHTNPGAYGTAYSGGFGPPNPSGPFLQQHVSSNPGAPFSQQQVGPSPAAGPFPQNLPSQSHGPVFPSQPLTQNYGLSSQPTYGSAFPAQAGNQNLPVSTQQPGGQQASQFLNSPGNPLFTQPQLPTAQQGFSSNTSFLSEQSQSLRPFAGVTANQGMQPNVVNIGFSSNSVFPTSLPGQTTAPWNFQSSQMLAMPPPGQPPAYSYPLTTIPPLSGLAQVPQAANLPIKNDQYDPLSDVTGSGLGGAPKVALAKPLPNGGGSGAEKTNLAPIKENIGQDLDPGKASNPASRSEVAEADNKTGTEDVGVVENLSPENWSPGPPADDVETGKGEALSKKSSRGLKMLRAAIADYVKEVLKPTWKEGYMSKEAFKTIAKKAVEKVVGNLPSHHIPKSQEKVDQFMKTSRPKISKLVQGYVDKYLKL